MSWQHDVSTLPVFFEIYCTSLSSLTWKHFCNFSPNSSSVNRSCHVAQECKVLTCDGFVLNVQRKRKEFKVTPSAAVMKRGHLMQCNHLFPCSLNITSFVASENKYCANIASFYLIRILSHLNSLLFSTTETCPTYVWKQNRVSYRISCVVRKWKRGNPIHRLVMQEKIACLYLTENHLDSCDEAELGPCIQLSLCHPDRILFQSITLPFSLEQKAWQREARQQLPLSLNLSHAN